MHQKKFQINSGAMPLLRRLSGEGPYKRYVKRPLDLILVLCAIIVLSPVLLITALLVRLGLGSPVIFRQRRPGLNERLFTLYKFRTMSDARSEDGGLLPDDARLTRFGRFLRASSLDELPELWNILRGDMSLVGPRPQLISDMLFMTPRQRLRHSVTPGLTGLAQVNGRNSILWDSKLDYDLKYIEDITFAGDAGILLRTLINVLRRKDINTDGMATAEDFGDYLLRVGSIGKDIYDAQLEESRRVRAGS